MLEVTASSASSPLTASTPVPISSVFQMSPSPSKIKKSYWDSSSGMMVFVADVGHFLDVENFCPMFSHLGWKFLLQ